MSSFEPYLVYYIWDASNPKVNIKHCNSSELAGYGDKSCHHFSFNKISTLYDVFANLFYWLDGQNLVEYESIYRLSSDFVIRMSSIRQRVNELWKGYILENELDASGQWTGPGTNLSSAMREAIGKSFAPGSVSSLDDVLITMMTWLKVLDRYFDNYYIYRHRNAHIPSQSWGRNEFLPPYQGPNDIGNGGQGEYRLTETVRGSLIFIHHNPIRETLHLKKVNDPDYTDVRKHARHLWLLPDAERRYEVRHRSIYRHDQQRPANRIRIGFLPGNMDFQAVNYDLNDCFELANEKPTRLFTFIDLQAEHYSEYSASVLASLEAMAANDCDVIIRPELATPLAMQNTIKARLEQHPGTKPELVMTGSFHSPEDDDPSGPGTYNVSLLLDGSGTTLGKIYKASRFIVHQTGLATIEGFEFLAERPAEEKIAIDRHELNIYETNFGRVAIFICIDFLTDEVEKILIERAVDLVFIMAMTDNPAGGKFLAMMRHLGEKSGAIVCNCNQSFPVLVDQVPGPNVVVNLPIMNSDGIVHPPFVLNTDAIVLDISSRFKPPEANGQNRSAVNDFRESRELAIGIPQDVYRGRENMLLALKPAPI